MFIKSTTGLVERSHQIMIDTQVEQEKISHFSLLKPDSDLRYAHILLAEAMRVMWMLCF